MGMPAAVHRRWTVTEVRALIAAAPGPVSRYELVDGELLVTPSPSGLHLAAVVELLAALRAYLLQTGVGEVFASPFDIELEPGTIVQPDVFVLSPDEARRIRIETPGRSLILGAEVISPGSARGDRGPKRELYQRRAPEYWIVDVDAALFERWRPGDERPEILREAIEWHPHGASFPFVLELAAYFARVAGPAA